MKDISSVETLAIPSDVTVAIKARKVTVTGPRGTLHKNVGHVSMDIQIVSLQKKDYGMAERKVEQGWSGTGSSSGWRKTRGIEKGMWTDSVLW